MPPKHTSPHHPRHQNQKQYRCFVEKDTDHHFYIPVADNEEALRALGRIITGRPEFSLERSTTSESEARLFAGHSWRCGHRTVHEILHGRLVRAMFEGQPWEMLGPALRNGGIRLCMVAPQEDDPAIAPGAPDEGVGRPSD